MDFKLDAKYGIGAIAGLGLGAGLMVLADPARGARRRGWMIQKAIHGTREADNLLNKASRDARNRGQGLFAGMRSLFRREAMSDDRLTARIRSKLGRYVSHPHAIQVAVRQGQVTLYGPVLYDEAMPLLRRVRMMRGVRGIDNRLELFKRVEHVPALQGGTRRVGERAEWFQQRWAPSTRLGIGALALSAGIYGASRRDWLGYSLSLLSAGPLIRAFSNLPFFQIARTLSGRSAVTVRKTINVAVPVDRVYGFWSHFQNFPAFLKEVSEVRMGDQGRSYWTVIGPAGRPIRWEAITTKMIPSREIAWRTLPGSLIPNSGRVRFSANEQGGTRIDIIFSYLPPAGALGHFAAMLFGHDPKSRLDDALAEMKMLIERGPSVRQLRRVKA